MIDYLKDKGKRPSEDSPKYIEKERGLSNGILNIDCATNVEQLVLTWINQIKLLVQTKDDTISNLNLRDFAKYLQYKTTGVLFDWLETTCLPISIPVNSQDTSVESKIVVLDVLSREIFKEFL